MSGWTLSVDVAVATIGGAAIEFILADPARLLEFRNWMARLGVDMPPDVMRHDLEAALALLPLEPS